MQRGVSPTQYTHSPKTAPSGRIAAGSAGILALAPHACSANLITTNISDKREKPAEELGHTPTRDAAGNVDSKGAIAAKRHRSAQPSIGTFNQQTSGATSDILGMELFGMFTLHSQPGCLQMDPCDGVAVGDSAMISRLGEQEGMVEDAAEEGLFATNGMQVLVERSHAFDTPHKRRDLDSVSLDGANGNSRGTGVLYVFQYLIHVNTIDHGLQFLSAQHSL